MAPGKTGIWNFIGRGEKPKTMKKINSNNSFDARKSAGNGKISCWPK
jgi:hypothetical protein